VRQVVTNDVTLAGVHRRTRPSIGDAGEQALLSAAVRVVLVIVVALLARGAIQDPIAAHVRRERAGSILTDAVLTADDSIRERCSGKAGVVITAHLAAVAREKVGARLVTDGAGHAQPEAIVPAARAVVVAILAVLDHCVAADARGDRRIGARLDGRGAAAAFGAAAWSCVFSAISGAASSPPRATPTIVAAALRAEDGERSERHRQESPDHCRDLQTHGTSSQEHESRVSHESSAF
jgi:hypothetical protein